MIDEQKEKPSIVLPGSKLPVALDKVSHDALRIAPTDTLKTFNIVVPDIFFWVEYDQTEKPTHMTCAFTYNSKRYGPLQFGETWPIDKDWSKVSRRTFEKKLMGKMVESLDLLVHHGDRILDSDGNIHPVRANDAEAERFFLDKNWGDRIGAFAKIVRVKAINKAKAIELGLI